MPEHIDLLRKCWFLAGPTAAGKTAVSLSLAQQLGAEIVSMDSMAIYRGMDIGTAKPSRQDRSGIPHYLIDVVDPIEEFSVSEYVEQAMHVAADIVARGFVPLFVGGTGLYLRSLLRGVFDGPEADWELRKDLEQQAGVNGRNWLHEQLAQVDAISAERLHPNDTRRIIRAIEVQRLTGKPLSEQQIQKPLAREVRPKHVYWLDPPRSWLHERINRRVDQMITDGLEQEVRHLLAMTPPPGRTARQALGYREIIDYIENQTSLTEAIDQIKTGTRQFAKRQHTWFRNLEECASIPVTGQQDAEQLVKSILQTSN